MAATELDSRMVQIDKALADPGLQAATYSATARLAERRKDAIAGRPDFEELREHARRIKKHTLDHLDHYLEEFEKNAAASGARVVWCRDGSEAGQFILDLARKSGISLIVKSKSMTTEEIHLNHQLEEHQVEAVETDLGEYILQLAGETPFHIIAPAIHKTRYDVADIFEKRIGSRRETEPEKLTQIARAVLREKFLAAGMGVTGANFLVADSGAVVVVENEGNARLTSSAPRIHVAVAGIEKVIPRAQDLAVFLHLLARSATGQPLSVYTSFLNGPARPGETHGPSESYILLLDNGRTKLLADRHKRESLYCIRCGACLNHCPVYRKIGGHSYPWVYSGPIGAILTPQYMGLKQEPWLPFASSLCGACAEVCPVKIDIPRVLLELRREITASGARGRLEQLAFRVWAWVMRHPAIYERLGALAAGVVPEGEPEKWIRDLPGFMAKGPLGAWLSQRDLPPPAPRSFRQLWRDRK